MRARGARLYWRPARSGQDGRISHPATYVIRDGERMISCRTIDHVQAGRQLGDYIAAKHSPERNRPAARVFVTDVLAKYLKDLAREHARPRATGLLCVPLLKFFQRHTLADVTGDLCRRYAAQRSTDAIARRELECLKAAINHAHREGLVREVIGVWLPPRRPAREKWLTPKEAAALVRHCWRYRETKNGKPTPRATRKHVAKFIMVALRTGRRAGVVVGAKLSKSSDSTYVDLDTGLLMPKPRHVQTKKKQPPIKLPDRLLAHMRRWKRQGQKYVIEYNGKPVTRMGVAFRLAVEATGLGDDVTPHTLRHTAATWGMQRGADIWSLSGYLGMSVKTLTTIYAHHAPDHLASAVDVYNRPGGQPVAATGNRERKRHKMTKNGQKRPAKAYAAP
jgi:integrase